MRAPVLECAGFCEKSLPSGKKTRCCSTKANSQTKSQLMMVANAALHSRFWWASTFDNWDRHFLICFLHREKGVSLLAMRRDGLQCATTQTMSNDEDNTFASLLPSIAEIAFAEHQTMGNHSPCRTAQERSRLRTPLCASSFDPSERGICCRELQRP